MALHSEYKMEVLGKAWSKRVLLMESLLIVIKCQEIFPADHCVFGTCPGDWEGLLNIFLQFSRQRHFTAEGQKLLKTPKRCLRRYAWSSNVLAI